LWVKTNAGLIFLAGRFKFINLDNDQHICFNKYGKIKGGINTVGKKASNQRSLPRADTPIKLVVERLSRMLRVQLPAARSAIASGKRVKNADKYNGLPPITVIKKGKKTDLRKVSIRVAEVLDSIAALPHVTEIWVYSTILKIVTRRPDSDERIVDQIRLLYPADQLDIIKKVKT
jgi:hypothetical protein